MELNIFENCNFTLRSVNASTINASKTDMTWNNIDLRQVLGKMYDKYEKFKIVLVSVSQKNIGTFANGYNDSVVLLNMTGLPFENCCYDYSQKCNTDNCVIGIMKFLEGYGYNPNTQLGYNFTKHNGANNIRIYYTRCKDGAVPNPSNKTFVDVAFHFCIYGLK